MEWRGGGVRVGVGVWGALGSQLGPMEVLQGLSLQLQQPMLQTTHPLQQVM